MNKIAFVLFVLILISQTSVFAQDKEYHCQFSKEEIIVDGKDDDKIWQKIKPVSFVANENEQLKETPPNIVFVICDQMRGDAFAAAGNNNVKTPNIDRLANGGVMFHNNYSNNSVCLPSRVSMFSGLYPNQTGIFCNNHDGEWLSFEKSLPWYLQNAGYKIGYVGKNHTFIPTEFSNFDTVSLRGREECRNYSKYVPPYWHSDMFWPEEDCNPGKNTSDAINFINNSNPAQPFFLTVSYFDPHPPYMAPAQYTSQYNAQDIELPEYIDPAKLGDRLADHQKALHYDKVSEADLKETMRYYYASIEWGVDHQLKGIMKALEEKGIADNTVLVFTSDHGDFMGQHHMVRKGMFLYDALLNVPMIWYAPGLIKKGLSPENMTQNVDIFPTLLDFAGVEIPKHLVGRSLKNILQGEKVLDDGFVLFASEAYSDLPGDYWDEPELYFDPESDVPFHTRVERMTWNEKKKTAMVRNKDWKLIVSETHSPELYFMNGGNIERENLYGKPEHEAVYQSLKKELDKRWKW
jgi:arylsulfatase A-like enzyme